MIAKTNTQYYQNIADSVRYSLDGTQYESSLSQARAELNSLIDRSITTITSDVTSIGDYAFYTCPLTEVNFPNATSIGDSAFYSCTSLTEANFPNVTSIGSSAFTYRRALVRVNFPEVTYIRDNTFYDCRALTEVNFPKVTYIGLRAFSGCKSIKYFDMSEVAKVPTLGYQAFEKTTCIFLFRDQTQLDTYASATNWSALASRFQIKGATT